MSNSYKIKLIEKLSFCHGSQMSFEFVYILNAEHENQCRLTSLTSILAQHVLML